MRGLGILAAALVALVPAGCGNDVDDAGSEWPRRDLKIMAPADPGGGWDTTAREMAHVIEDSDVIPKNVEVYNVTGGWHAARLRRRLVRPRRAPVRRRGARR